MGSYRRPTLIRWLLPLLLVLLLASCRSSEERVADHMAKAEAFRSEGRDQDAVIEYRAALSLNPELGAAHFELAKAYLRLKQAPAAYWELQETVRLDPENDEARRSLGALALASNDFEEALKQADAAIAADYSAGDAYLVRAEALEALERLDEAESAYRAAADVRPDDSGYLMVLSGFYERQKQMEKAEELLRKVIDMEASYESYLAYAMFLRRSQSRPEETEAAFRKSIELAKQNQKHLVYAEFARYYESIKNDDKAAETLKEGIEKARKTEPLILQLTRFYRARGEAEEADKLIQQVTEGRRMANPEPHLTLAAYRMDRGDLDGALAAANAAVDADPTHGRSKLRKAEILIELGFEKDEAQLDEAAELVEGVLKEDPENTNALFVRSKVEMARGDLATAAETLRSVTVARPKWPIAHMVLGSVLFDLGEMQTARAELSRAIELDAGLLDARFLMARVHEALGEHEYAIEQGRVYLRVYRAHVPTRLLVAKSLVALGRRDDAARELEAIPAEDRDYRVYYSLGKLAVLRGDMEKASENFLAADGVAPNTPEVLEALMDLEMGAGDSDSPLIRIAAAVEAEPENSQLLSLLGKIRLANRNTQGAEQAFKQAIEADPQDLEAYRLLGDVYHGTGRLKDALDVYERAVKANPNEGWLYERVALLAEKTGDRKRAMESYQQGIDRDPSLGLSKNNLSYLLVEEGGDLDRALGLAEQAMELRPNDAGTADTLGWVLLKKGRNADAIEYLREAEKRWGEDSLSIGIVRHHLAMAYEADGSSDMAVTTLENALAGMDKQMAAMRAAGQDPAEPPWAVEMREMATRLKN